MSGQHTPGPWEFIPPDRASCGAITAKTGWICDFAEEPSEANARLMTAAPSMLTELHKARAALKEQLEVHIQSCTNRVSGLVENDEDRLSIESDQDMLDGIDRVIDQAEGRA